jgi:multicomponent Na+:H+ antiporter subunit D
LNSRLPVTGLTSFFGAMSISGVPPFGGFWSKLIIIIAALQAGQFWFALIAALVSIVTLAYYLKFQTFAFFGKLNEALSGVKEAAFTMKFSMLVLAALCAGSGFLLLPQLRFFLQSAVNVIR